MQTLIVKGKVLRACEGMLIQSNIVQKKHKEEEKKKTNIVQKESIRGFGKKTSPWCVF